MCVYGNTETRSFIHCCNWKSKLQCAFVALGIQHAMRIRRIYRHLWPVMLYTIFPNIMIFEKKNLLNVMCVFQFSLQLLSEIFVKRN